jgi:mannitol-1-phosphate/altronate dehydrogenase
MEGRSSEIVRMIAASERESTRLEERVAALESVVDFLVTRISEDRGRPIKSDLERSKQCPDAAATYDDWPDNPMEW